MSGSRRELCTRQTLQGFYEQLDRKWRDAEELLLSLSVPAPVTQPIRTAEPEFPRAPRYRHELGFIKHYGRWGLCYGVCAEDDPRDQYWTSIHRCSIEQRVEAAQAFPALRDQMLQAAERYTQTVAHALSVLRGSLAARADGDETASQQPLHTEEPQADEISHEDESADLLADESSEPAPLPEQPEVSFDAPRELADELIVSGEAEILGPIESDRSLILWTARDCAGINAQPLEAPAVADTALEPAPSDEPPTMILPFSLQCWESDGGEIAQEAA